MGGVTKAAGPAVSKRIVKAPSIHVRLHVATIGRYQEVLDETLSVIGRAGLAAHAESVCVGVVGRGVVSVAVLPAAEVYRWSDEVTAYEHPTLDAMQNLAQDQPDGRILYLNCLGGRHVGPGWRVRASWRKMLNTLLVEDWRERIKDLETHSVVGASWSKRPLPHMTSNNWWARAEHLTCLPTIAEFVEQVRGTDFTGLPANWAEPEAKARHAGEYWLGSIPAVKAHSCLPLSTLGLPTNEFGEVPWWGYDRVDWSYCAERRKPGGRTFMKEMTWLWARADLNARAKAKALMQACGVRV